MSQLWSMRHTSLDEADVLYFTLPPASRVWRRVGKQRSELAIIKRDISKNGQKEFETLPLLWRDCNSLGLLTSQFYVV